MMKLVYAAPWILVLQLNWFAAVCPARAQGTGGIAVLPVGTEKSLGDASQVAAILANHLAGHGSSAIAVHDARDRLLSSSRPAQTLNASELDTLTSLAREATNHVAFGRTDAARRAVRELITRAEGALETLNRETATARQLLDACLALVRSSLQRDDREAARSQAMICRRLVPDLTPSPEAHPALVIGVLAEADHILRNRLIGGLSVRTVLDEHCSVYLNGRHVGTTPFAIEQTAAGEYRVQVECGEVPGRVHLVRLGEEPVSLIVDTRFDRAIRSSPTLALHYPDDGEEREQWLFHALEFGRTIGAHSVVSVRLEAKRAILARVHVAQRRVVASAQAAWESQRGVDLAQLAKAVDALLEGRFEGELSGPPLDVLRRAASSQSVVAASDPMPSGDSPRAEQPPAPRPAERARDETRARPVSRRTTSAWRRTLDITATVLGVGSYALAGAYLVQRRHAGDRLRQSSLRMPALYRSRLQAWTDSRVEPYLWGAVGTGLLAIGLIDLTMATDRKPGLWALAVAGLVGVGLAAWGAADVARGETCDGDPIGRGACSAGLEQRDRGAVVMLSALPPLAYSLAGALRRAPAVPAATSWIVQPSITSTRAGITLHMRWL